MKRVVSVMLLIAVASFMFAGCAAKGTIQGPPSGMKALTMADLGFVDMDKGEDLYSEALYPFDEKPVYYMVSGIDKYDQFFKSTATITGTLYMIERVWAAVESQNADLIAKFAIKPGSIPPVDVNSPLYLFVTKTVPASVTAVSSLISQAKSLALGVSTDFIGRNALKAPKVANGLAETGINLKKVYDELAKRLPNILPEGEINIQADIKVEAEITVEGELPPEQESAGQDKTKTADEETNE